MCARARAFARVSGGKGDEAQFAFYLAPIVDRGVARETAVQHNVPPRPDDDFNDNVEREAINQIVAGSMARQR